MSRILKPNQGTLSLIRDPSDPSRTVIIFNGRRQGSVPWQQCDAIADSFKRAARVGEEYAKVEKVIESEAFLIRTGAPFGLSTIPGAREEAYKEAQWGDARTKMPIPSIPSPRAVGTPTLFKSPRSES